MPNAEENAAPSGKPSPIKTSNLPFAAILAGRNRFVASEYFDWRFMVAVVEIAVFLLFHNYLFGMSPFPNNWLPF
jgi:uncharacterized membrane protein